MDIVNIIISLLSGIAGGNIAGSAMQDKGLGVLGNTITGLIGGGAGGYILKLLGLFAATATTTAITGQPSPMEHGHDITTLIGNIVGSGVGGAILTAVVAWLKNASEQK